MREIKFRGQRIDNNKFVYGYYFYKSRTKQHIIYCSESEGVLVDKEFEIKPETLSQFTGLEDKNCKEIYEGDILRLGNTCSFVVWCLDGWKFNSYMERGILNLYVYINPTTGNEVAEIIGNIHENPELLKN